LLPVFAALLGCGLILGFAKPAEARMRFCNYSDEKLAVSWAWKDTNGDWISEGHHIHEPGQCKTVYPLPLRSRIYYYYAQAYGGNSTYSTSTSKKANREFCISDKRYKIRYDGTSIPYKDEYYEAGGWKESCEELRDNRDETYVTYHLEDFVQIDTGRLGIRCTVYLKRNGGSGSECSLL